MSDEIEKRLAEVVGAYQDDEDLAVHDGWKIAKLGEADWALSRILDMRREIERADALEREAVARLRSRAETLRDRAGRGIRFFEGRLREYFELSRTELLQGGKKKSVSLLHGSIGWRKGGGKLLVTDEKALLDWCRAQPVETEVLRIKEEVNKAALNKRFKETGELPIGTDVEPEIEELSIRLDEGSSPEDR